MLPFFDIWCRRFNVENFYLEHITRVINVSMLSILSVAATACACAA